MTDLEMIQALLARTAAKMAIETSNVTASDVDAYDTWSPLEAGDTRVCVQHGHGYDGFYAEFLFRPDGSLRSIGAWE
jgi:hypothetical protein